MSTPKAFTDAFGHTEGVARPESDPRLITSYDVLKTLGVFLMIVDHVGLYLYPDNEMLRVIGRLAAPIFLFLIGFARNRDVPFSWVFWVALDMMVSYAVGMAPKPNILLTLMLVRLSLDYIEPLVYPRSRFTIAFLVFAFVAGVLIDPFIEYGAVAWPLAALGLWARKDGVAGMSWMAAVLFAYFAYEGFKFGFSDAGLLIFAGGVMCLCPLLACFDPDGRIRLKTSALAGVYRLCGRYSLIIYAIHLIALKILWLFVH